MRILIVGGGIAGLTLAARLHQKGLRARVIEIRNSPQAGYIIGLWPMGIRVLKELGLFEHFADVSAPMVQFSMGDKGGRVINSTDMLQMRQKYGSIQLVERKKLLDLLASAVGEGVERGLSVARIEPGAAKVEVRFSDGSEDTFDLVVGCDGLHSRVRDLVFGIRALATGWSGWAWWGDRASVEDARMMEYWEVGRRFFAVVRGLDVLCFFAGMPTPAPAAVGVATERLRASFADMGGLVPQALESLDGDREFFHTEFSTIRLKAWSCGRVVLVGDACSAFFPFGGVGIGASMAMEAAAVLSDELSRVDDHFVLHALRSYQSRRRDRVAEFEEASQSAANLMLSDVCQPKSWKEILLYQQKMFETVRGLMEEPI